MHGGDAEFPGDRLGGGAVVAGGHDDVDISLAEGGKRLSRGRLDRIGHGKPARQLAVHRRQQRDLAVAAQGLQLRLRSGGVDAEALHQTRRAEHDVAAIDAALDALARDGLEGFRRRQLKSARFGALDDGLGQGMLARLLQARGQAQEHAFVEAVERRDVGEDGLAFGERACLVDDDGIDGCQPLQRLGIFDEDALARAASSRNHDRNGRGESQGARAGNDENGYCCHNGIGE